MRLCYNNREGKLHCAILWFTQHHDLANHSIFFNSQHILSARFSILHHAAVYSSYQSHASLNDPLPLQKLSSGGRQSNVSMTIVMFFSCQFHSHVWSSLDQVLLGNYDKVISNFAEMEGYYIEKTWSIFKSHSWNTFCEWNVCEGGGISIVQKQN